MGDRSERRGTARVRARGCVVIHGEGYVRGQIVDLSTSGMRFQLARPAAYGAGDRVELELRFDGMNGGWWWMSGHVVRIGPQNEIAVAFDRVPSDFQAWIQAELVAILAAEAVYHVLLVDPVGHRRGEIAATLRAAGHGVTEAATPLDAIDHLGESRCRPRLIAIADTIPARVAEDLRAYVRAAHPHLMVLRMMGGLREPA